MVGEGEEEGALDRELDAIARRRRSSAAILQLLQGMRAGILSEAGGDSETDQQRRSTERDNDRERERVVLINPFNQTIILQGSYDTSNESISRAPIGSLGDYFVGPGLDLLLQHLSENDPTGTEHLQLRKRQLKLWRLSRLRRRCSALFVWMTVRLVMK